MLRLGATGLGLAAVGSRAIAAPRRIPVSGPRLVLLNLKGGNDGLNTLVPHTLSSYYERRGSLALSEAETLDLNAGPFANTSYRLHPSLSDVRDLYVDGDVAFVQKVGYPDPNGSHFTSQTIFSRAMRDVSALSGTDAAGWVARYADRLAPSPTGAIAVGSGLPEDFKGGSTSLLGVAQRLSSFRLEVDGKYTNTGDKHRKETVRELLAQFRGTPAQERVRDTIFQAHELESSVQDADANYASDVAYGGDRVSESLQSVAKLIQAGFDTGVYYVSRGGFDTHGGQRNAQASLLAEVNNGLSSFASDLKAMGVWDDTVVLVISEFGRRNFINGSSGTDHGAGNCMLLLGGAVRGGIVGEDIVDDDLTANNLEYRVDFRTIYREVAQNHLGLGSDDLAAVFPESFDGTSLGLV